MQAAKLSWMKTTEERSRGPNGSFIKILSTDDRSYCKEEACITRRCLLTPCKNLLKERVGKDQSIAKTLMAGRGDCCVACDSPLSIKHCKKKRKEPTAHDRGSSPFSSLQRWNRQWCSLDDLHNMHRQSSLPQPVPLRSQAWRGCSLCFWRGRKAWLTTATSTAAVGNPGVCIKFSIITVLPCRSVQTACCRAVRLCSKAQRKIFSSIYD